MMNGNNKFDERQKELIGKSMAISAVLVFIYEIGFIIYMLKKTGSIKFVYTEMILVVIMFSFMLIHYIINGEYDSSIEKSNKRTNIFKMDERKKLRVTTSIGMANFIAMLYSIGIIIFRFIQTKSFESSYTYIGLLILITVTMSIYNLINKEYNVPTTFFGKKLPLGKSKEDKKIRIIQYAKDALRLSIVFLIFDIMNPNRVLFSIPSIDSKTILPYFLNSLIRFILFLIMNYAWGEYNVKKQRKFNESLDDGDIEGL